MSRSDWIGIIGIILTLIIGIPSIPLFAQGNIPLAITAAILAVLILLITVYFYRRYNLPPFSVISNETLVEIKDPAGKASRYRKTVTLRPNHPGLDHYTHRNMSADGNLFNFRVDPGVTLVANRVSAGDHFVTVRFPHQLSRSRPVTTWLEVDCGDSFTSSRESVILVVDQPTKAALIEIILPQERLPRDVKAIYRSAGKDEELSTPTVTGNRISWRCSYKLRNLAPGEYEVMWNW